MSEVEKNPNIYDLLSSSPLDLLCERQASEVNLFKRSEHCGCTVTFYLAVHQELAPVQPGRLSPTPHPHRPTMQTHRATSHLGQGSAS